MKKNFVSTNVQLLKPSPRFFYTSLSRPSWITGFYQQQSTQKLPLKTPHLQTTRIKMWPRLSKSNLNQRWATSINFNPMCQTTETQFSTNWVSKCESIKKWSNNNSNYRSKSSDTKIRHYTMKLAKFHTVEVLLKLPKIIVASWMMRLWMRLQPSIRLPIVKARWRKTFTAVKGRRLAIRQLASSSNILITSTSRRQKTRP